MTRHRYNFFADPDAMERLRAHAEARGTTTSDLIRTAILHYLEVLDAMPAPAEHSQVVERDTPEFPATAPQFQLAV